MNKLHYAHHRKAGSARQKKEKKKNITDEQPKLRNVDVPIAKREGLPQEYKLSEDAPRIYDEAPTDLCYTSPKCFGQLILC